MGAHVSRAHTSGKGATSSSSERASSEHAPQRRGDGRLREPQHLAAVIEEEPARSAARELGAERIERPRVGYADVARGLHLDRQEAKAARNVRVSEDRKSTRLNSSHVSISYAVFCLK